MKTTYSKATNLTKVADLTHQEFCFIEANYSIIETQEGLYIEGDHLDLEEEFAEQVGDSVEVNEDEELYYISDEV